MSAVIPSSTFKKGHGINNSNMPNHHQRSAANANTRGAVGSRTNGSHHHHTAPHHNHHRFTGSNNKGGSLSSSVAAPSRRDISMLMLLIAAETVVSVSQPHHVGGLRSSNNSTNYILGGGGHSSSAGAGGHHHHSAAPAMLSTEMLATAIQLDPASTASILFSANEGTLRFTTVNTPSLPLQKKAAAVKTAASIPSSSSVNNDSLIDAGGGVSNTTFSNSHVVDDDEEDEMEEIGNSGATPTPVPTNHPSDVDEDDGDDSVIIIGDTIATSASSASNVHEKEWIIGNTILKVPSPSSSSADVSSSMSGLPFSEAVEETVTATGTFQPVTISSAAIAAAAAHREKMAMMAASSSSSTSSAITTSNGYHNHFRHSNNHMVFENNVIVTKTILSFLTWREAVHVRGVSKTFFRASLNTAMICRMPSSGTKAVFIPYRFQGAETVEMNRLMAIQRSGSSSSSSFASSSSSSPNHHYQQVNNGSNGFIAATTTCAAVGNGGPSSSMTTMNQPHFNPNVETAQWNSQSTSWLCAACGHTNNSPARIQCAKFGCGAVIPSHWNSQRLFLGQLRRDATIPFVLWFLTEIMGLSKGTIRCIENHRDRATGRGKGCAWVTIASSSSSANATNTSNQNAENLLTLHHRAFFDILHGVEGVWLTTADNAEGLDKEAALRTNGGGGSREDKDSSSSSSSTAAHNTHSHSALPTQHHRHMPRSSLVVEATSPNQGLPAGLIGRSRNFPIHYVPEVVMRGAEESNDEDFYANYHRDQQQKSSSSSASATSSSAASDSGEQSNGAMRTPHLTPTGKIRFVHNPYYSPASAAASGPKNNGGSAPTTAPIPTTTTVISGAMGAGMTDRRQGPQTAY